MNKNLGLPLSQAGKSISFAPCLKDKERLLKDAAKKKFYYPMLALKQLKALSSGPIGKSNVYIPNLNDSRAHTLSLFYIFLPGIKATIERRPNDSLVVTQLELSEGYKNDLSNGRPGIYAVTWDGNEATVKHKNNDRITPDDGRVVIVCDNNHESPQIAAKKAGGRLEETVGRAAAQIGNFDVFYTPYGGGLGGMRHYDPRSITDSYAFAGLLANAMKYSQNKKGIFWVSEYGGSAILTQSMAVVAQEKIELKNHSVFMYKPKTNPAEALRLANSLKLKVGKEFAQVSGIRPVISSMVMRTQRALDKKDTYNLKDYADDTANGVNTIAATMGALTFTAGLFTANPILTGIGSVTGGIGAVHLLWTKAKNTISSHKK